MHRPHVCARALSRAVIAVVDMTRIGWCSIDALDEAIAAFDPTVLVSIYSPRWPIGDIGDRPHLRLAFDDVERTALDRMAPDHRHVGAFLELLEHNPDRLLIHCRAGLSRSPAFAIVAAVKAGHDPIATCAEARRLWPHSQPNRLILQIADEMIGSSTLTAAQTTFAYSRTGHDNPAGDRAGLCVLDLAATRSEAGL